MVDALHSLYLWLRDAQSGRLTSEIAKTGV
jgi:hypothetical protein